MADAPATTGAVEAVSLTDSAAVVMVAKSATIPKIGPQSLLIYPILFLAAREKRRILASAATRRKRSKWIGMGFSKMRMAFLYFGIVIPARLGETMLAASGMAFLCGMEHDLCEFGHKSS